MLNAMASGFRLMNKGCNIFRVTGGELAVIAFNRKREKVYFTYLNGVMLVKYLSGSGFDT